MAEEALYEGAGLDLPGGHGQGEHRLLRDRHEQHHPAAGAGGVGAGAGGVGAGAGPAVTGAWPGAVINEE